MPRLDFLTQIDTNRFGLQRPNLQQKERILPIEDRSAYRFALNRSLQESDPSRRIDTPESIDLSERNRRTEISSSRIDEHRFESREHAIPSRPKLASSDEDAHEDDSKIPPKTPQTVLDRLETNVAQIVPNLDDFPIPPSGLVESINPAIQVSFATETNAVNGNADLSLQIDLEEIPVAPESLIEAIGKFQGDEDLQNSTEVPDVLVNELQRLKPLIQNEISTEVPLQEPAKKDADSLPEANVEGVIVAQIPGFETAEGLDTNQPFISTEFASTQSDPTPDILPVGILSKEINSEESQNQEDANTTSSKNISNPETDSSTKQNLLTVNGVVNKTEFLQNDAHDAETRTNSTTSSSIQTSNPSVQSSEQSTKKVTDSSEANSDGKPVTLSQNESLAFANLRSQAANQSETGLVDSQDSKDNALPNSSAHFDVGTSDSKASIQSSTVRLTTPSAIRAAKNLNAEQLVDHVSQAVRVSQQSGKTMKFRLQPPELGTLQVEIRQDNGMLTARLEVHTEAALKAITHNITQLRDAIHHTGGNIEKINVQFAESRNEHQPSNHSRQQGQEQKQNGERQGSERNRNSFGSENESGDENDTHLRTDPGKQVDIQV